MLKKLLASLLLLSPMIADEPFGMGQSQELVVNNRILAKVQDKTISVLDVMKKMDVYLARYYPQYAKSAPARYQFFSSNWRDTLNQMIDNELMVADAEAREIKVSDGEVREEVQLRFGPNVMGTLHDLNVTYEEARRMVQQDMIVQRMNWFRVTSKALQKVNSQDVKEAYKKYCEANPPKEEWKYQMLSIRAASKEEAAAAAAKATALLKHEGMTLQAAADELSEPTASLAADAGQPAASLSINLSPEYTTEGKALTEAHKAVLSKLKAGAFSEPVEQTSRDGSVVFRVFHLKDHTLTEPPKFHEVADQLKDTLLQQVAAEENAQYVAKLRQRFGYDEKSLDIPADFEPFQMH